MTMMMNSQIHQIRWTRWAIKTFPDDMDESQENKKMMMTVTSDKR